MTTTHTPASTKSSCYVLLRGTGLLGEGQTLRISEGQSVVAGRSRWCDWSLKRSPAYLKSSGSQRRRLQASLEFTSTSRRHVRITLHNAKKVEIESLGGNGTLLEGEPVERIVLEDVTQRPYSLRMGPRGPVLVLSPGSLPI